MTTPMKSAAEVMAEASAEFMGRPLMSMPRVDRERRAEEARAQIAALDAAGYAIVPKEPSERMIFDGWNALMEWDARTGDDKGIADIYCAMLATAAATTPKED